MQGQLQVKSKVASGTIKICQEHPCYITLGEDVYEVTYPDLVLQNLLSEGQIRVEGRLWVRLVHDAANGDVSKELGFFVDFEREGWFSGDPHKVTGEMSFKGQSYGVKLSG